MILVDTSVWIDHLRAVESGLVDLLERDEVGCHPLVVEELALGSIKQRGDVLELLGRLRMFPQLNHDEALQLVDGKRLWGRGLSAVDAHLLGSVAVVPGGELWTRDKRLIAAGREIGVQLWVDPWPGDDKPPRQCRHRSLPATWFGVGGVARRQASRGALARQVL